VDIEYLAKVPGLIWEYSNHIGVFPLFKPGTFARYSMSTNKLTSVLAF
jgi:hypothetical protein